jgi:hypothetical protein
MPKQVLTPLNEAQKFGGNSAYQPTQECRQQTQTKTCDCFFQLNASILLTRAG